MSKADFNKEIVLLRHDVRKARVGVVWKLTKEVKLLKKRIHGNEKQIEKCRRKSEKLIRQINILKKLKDDDISKFAIANTKSIEAVLADPRAKARARVLIRLASHNALKSKIENLREKFPDYPQYLTAQKKSKLNDKIKSKKQDDSKIKNQKIVADTEVENTRIKSDQDAISDAGSSDDSEGDVSEAEDSGSKLPPDEQVDRGPCQVKITKTPTNEKKDMRSIKCELPDTILPELKKRQTIKVVSKLATVKRLKLDDDQIEDDDSDEVVEESAENSESKDDTVQVDREVDSFFMTANGKNDYLRVVVPKINFPSDDLEKDEDSSSARYHHNNPSFFGYNDHRNTQNHVRKYNRNDNSAFSRDRESSKFQNNKMRNEPIKKGPRQDQTNELSSEEVHPSWAAKKKQQNILKQGFQGQKIVFDDD